MRLCSFGVLPILPPEVRLQVHQHAVLHLIKVQLIKVLAPDEPLEYVQRLAEALQLLCRAYDLTPGTAIVLNLLAHNCLLRGDYEKACLCCASLSCSHCFMPANCHSCCGLQIFCRKPVCHQPQVTALAMAALQTADSEQLRADAETLLARAAHAKNDLRTAFAHYRQVRSVAPLEALPNPAMLWLSKHHMQPVL
jgi:hypothetical protein